MMTIKGVYGFLGGGLALLIGGLGSIYSSILAWLFLYGDSDAAWKPWRAWGQTFFISICLFVIPVIGACIGRICGALVQGRLNESLAHPTRDWRIHLLGLAGISAMLLIAIPGVLYLTWIILSSRPY